MIQILLLELIGLISIFNIYSIWTISYNEHILGLLFISTILTAYLTINKKWSILKGGIKHLERNYQIQDMQREHNYLIELRKMGIFLASFSIIVIPIIVLLNGWVFIGIDIIAKSVAITSSIVLYTLLLEAIMILPLVLLIQYRIKQNRTNILSLNKNKVIDMTRDNEPILLKKLK